MRASSLRLTVVSLLISLACVSAQERGSASSVVEGNVVKTGTTVAIGGATVTFTAYGREPKSVITDELGKFTVELAPGRYRIDASRPEFVKSSGDATDISINAAERIRGLRVQLTPTGVISGRVLDASGAVKVGAVVTAVSSTYKKGHSVLAPCSAPKNQRVLANDKGEYRVFGLAPGEYYLGVQADNTCTTPSHYYPGVTDPSNAVLANVRSGDELGGLDLRLTESKTFVARFKIVQPTAGGAGTSGGIFQATRRGRNGLQTTELLMMLARLKQLSDGRVESPPLPPGSYDFYYSPSVLPIEVGHLSVDIVDRDVDAGTLEVAPSATVTGQVRVAGTTPPGWEYRNLFVRLIALDSRESVLEHRSRRLGADAKERADGSFSLVMARGTYVVEIRGLPPEFYIQTIRYASREVDRVNIDSASSSLEIVVSGSGGTISGTVTNNTNQPTQGYVVLIPPPARRHDPSRFKTAATDQYGRFSITGIAPDEYGIIASDLMDPAAFANDEFLRRFESRSTKVKTLAGTHTNTDLRLVAISNDR